MIRAWTPELAFHDEFKPILSLSVSSNGRFATAGADHNIRLWRLDDDHRDGDGCPRVVFLSNISKHSLPVNVVRFSPDGKLLASASDDCNVMLWTQDEKQAEDSGAVDAAAESPTELHTVAAPATEQAAELDNDVICLTPASPTRSPPRPSDNSASSPSLSASSPTTPPGSHTLLSPPASPAATPFASDPESDFSSLNVEQWSRASLLRGHLSEIYALHWSPCGGQLVTGSIEGRVVVWQLEAGGGGASRKVQRQELSDHNGYVQGVGWDPRGELVVSASSDRTVKVYRWGKRKGEDGGLECKLIHTLKGRRTPPEAKVEEQIDDDVVMVDAPTRTQATELSTPTAASPASLTATAEQSSAAPITDSAVSEASPTAAAPSSSSSPLFVDETLPSFFRRPAWSPDGLFVLLPAGCYVEQGKTSYCTWMYHRDDFSEPLACLTHTEPSVAVIFSPHPYRPSSIAAVSAPSSPSSSLSYAHLFIVATTKSLLLYCTHSPHALASLTNLHLSALTDLSWATQQPAPPPNDELHQPEHEQAGEAVPDTRKKWALEDRVLVSSSDGYISVVDMQGVAEKLDGAERAQWDEQVAQDVVAARRRIEEGEGSEVKQKKRKHKKKRETTNSAIPATSGAPAEGQAESAAAEAGAEACDEGKSAHVVTVFELTDEMKAQLQQMVDAGVQIMVDSVREHCKVSVKRASRMARKWKELQKSVKKAQKEAAAKAAAERWEKMDKEQKERALHTPPDNGKEEKVEAVDGRKDGEPVGGESGEKRKKSHSKAPVVPVEDAKRMKKIDSFFAKSTTTQYAVATPSSASHASPSSSSSSSPLTNGVSCLSFAPLPLLPEDTSVVGAKRKIVPVLISSLTPIDAVSNTSAPPSTTTPAKRASKDGKKKPKSSKKASKKAAAASSTSTAPIAISQSPTTAPALFAPPQPAQSATPTAASVSIDLTDERSVPTPPAPVQSAVVADAGVAADMAAAVVAVEGVVASEAACLSGALIVRQGSGSRRVMAGPPPASDEQPPAKKVKRTIVPTVISPLPLTCESDLPQYHSGAVETASEPMRVSKGGSIASETHAMAVEVG